MAAVTSDPYLLQEAIAALVPHITNVMTTRNDVFAQPLEVNDFIEDDGTTKHYPCVTLLEAGLSEELMGGDTETKMWLALINVLIETAEAPTDISVKQMILGWRKALMDAYRQRLIVLGVGASIPNMQADVRSRAIFDAKSEQYQRVRSHFLIVLWVNEPRIGPLDTP